MHALTAKEHTLHSTSASTIFCTIFVSRNRPFSTVITRNFRPASVLLRCKLLLLFVGGGALLPRLRVLPLVLRSISSSIACELRMSRLVSDWTRMASCLSSR